MINKTVSGTMSYYYDEQTGELMDEVFTEESVVGWFDDNDNIVNPSDDFVKLTESQ